VGTPVPRIAIAIPPLVGLIAAALSIADTYQGGSVCDINSYISCTKVALSPYSSLMGISLSYWAAAYFTISSATSIAYMLTARRQLLKAVWGLSIAAIPIIAVLIYIEVAILKTLCLYCTAMHASIVAAALISTAYMLRPEQAS